MNFIFMDANSLSVDPLFANVAPIDLHLQPTSPCPVCGNPKLSHRACRVCGTYNGRQVIQPRQGETEAS